ncbi:MAG TPA: cyanophycin synthetase, partial [Deinococcales bacterium]|nr:cyanophycin synthetase [Deinococcales bacterium]
FAHTGASLQAALGALRPTTPGRLILVIGAAGERDVTRRTSLARVAAGAADLTVFTEEDHRTEPLDAILDLMSRTCLEAGGACVSVGDRREAIRHAFGLARPGDTVLLAGKGHERTLERTGETIPWDEAAVARELLA